MLSVYQLKPKFQNSLRPSVNWLAAKGISANQVTLFALLLSIVSSMALILLEQVSLLWLLAPLLLIRMALNAIDGMLAKEHKQKTKLGAYLNEVADVLSDVALIATLTIVPEISILALLAFAFIAILTEFVGVMGPMVSSERQYQGPMGKSDRALLISLIAIGLAVFPSLSIFINPILMIATLFAVLTIVNRVKAVIQDNQ